MTALPALRPEQLAAALAMMPAWTGADSGVWRDVRRVSLGEVADLVADLATMAVELDDEVGHRPELELHWRSGRLSVGVGVTGGVTEHDLDFARRVDERVAPTLPEDRHPALQAAIDLIDEQFDPGRSRR